jgi:hypothetical protein
VHENRLQEWEFKTTWGNPMYAKAMWILQNVPADQRTEEHNAYIAKHITEVERERTQIHAKIAAAQRALAEAPDRNLPMRKRTLRIPKTRPFTRTNTSLPYEPLNELRERAFRTTFESVSTFCTYVWMWAHAPDHKVPHVIAAKLHAFAAGTSWLDSLDRYRRTDLFQSAPMALVNPLNVDAFPATPGLSHPDTRHSWRETADPRPLDSKQSRLHAQKAQEGLATYITRTIDSESKK